MIGKLRGVVDSYNEDSVVLDVHGVGYLVHCSVRTLQSLPPPGEVIASARCAFPGLDTLWLLF